MASIQEKKKNDKVEQEARARTLKWLPESGMPVIKVVGRT
jgi:hypothetical protein